MQARFAFALLFISVAPVGCDDASEPSQVEHAITAKVQLTVDPDGEHVSFSTQNNSKAAVANTDLIGKTVFWATAAGGEPVTNAQPIDVVQSTLGPDLTTSITTPPHYGNGIWEVACVIAVSGVAEPAKLPAPGDLAAFDLTPLPAGEPPQTGVSVRVHVADANAEVTLDNESFIRFGK